jgi:hypothetical protein
MACLLAGIRIGLPGRMHVLKGIYGAKLAFPICTYQRWFLHCRCDSGAKALHTQLAINQFVHASIGWLLLDVHEMACLLAGIFG